MPIEIFAFGSGSLALVAIVLMVVTRVETGAVPPKQDHRRDR
jgi:hypothetical protein